MKVCYVITKADEIGGAQIHIRDLSKNLLKDGHIPVVITGEKGLLTDYLTAMGVEVHVIEDLQREISITKDSKALIRLVRLLKQIRPDIVSLHSSKAGILGRIACRILNIKVLFTAHGWAFANGVCEREKKKYIKIERFFSSFANRIITVSEQDKKLALDYKVASDNKQVVIHNGMYDVSNLVKNKTHTNADTINLIMVARFSEQKDHSTLYQSLSRLQHYNWHLNLVGKGPLLEENKKAVEELGLSERISFLGERDDVDQLLFQMDIFLLIANWEGFPRSILEAMRSSLPVIASDVGGVNEAIKDGVNGYLIPKGCIKSLTEKLSVLIESSEKRREMGGVNRSDFVKNFTFESMYQKTLKVYFEAIK